MTNRDEWQAPTPQEILDGLLKNGLTEAQFFFTRALVLNALESGEIRSKITCKENLKSFLEMAERMYVRNIGMATSDAELGMHIATCESPICNMLGKFYFEVLSPSQPHQSAEIAEKLVSLLTEILEGTPIPEKVGARSGFYDSRTGETMYNLAVVDITDKCIPEKPEVMARYKASFGEVKPRQIVLTYFKGQDGMFCDISDSYTASIVFNITQEFSQSLRDIFDSRAGIHGIDPGLLEMIIIANAPDIKQLDEGDQPNLLS